MTKKNEESGFPIVYDRVFKPSPDCTLYHYCSTPTFLSILASGAVRFSDANMMNDSEEGRYGYSLFEGAANDLLDMAKEKPALDGLTPDFLDQVDSYLSPKQFITHPVIACFSKNPDVLGQWRAYGQDGRGWAVGFSGEAIGAMPVTLLNVLYDVSKQREEVLNSLAAMYVIWRQKGGDFHEAVGDDASFLASLLLASKHPSFRDEQEVRALHELRVDRAPEGWSLVDEGGVANGEETEGLPVGFRADDAAIVAHLDIPLQRSNNVSIRELWFGPRNPNALGNAVYPLTRFGHRNVVLHRSASSYRG